MFNGGHHITEFLMPRALLRQSFGQIFGGFRLARSSRSRWSTTQVQAWKGWEKRQGFPQKNPSQAILKVATDTRKFKHKKKPAKMMVLKMNFIFGKGDSSGANC